MKFQRTPVLRRTVPAASRFFFAIGFALANMTILPGARAASLVWSGTTDAIWATSTNWSPTGVPGTGDTATFNSAGNGNTTISLGPGVTINTIVFDTASAAAYTIGSGAVGSQTLTLNNGGAITLNATVGNSQLFNSAIVLGTDTTVASYTFTNNSTTKTLTLAGNISRNGATNTKTLSIAGAGNTIINGVVSGTLLALTKSGTGTLTLSGTNTFTGALTISGGKVIVPMVNNASTAGPLGNSATAVSMSGSVTLEYTGGTASSSKDFSLGNSISTFQIDSAATELTLSAAMDGAGGTLKKTGPGTLTLTGANTYTGETWVSAGTLKVSGAGKLGSTAAFLQVDSGATLDMGGTSQTVNGILGFGTIVNNGGGAVTLTSNPTSNNSVFDGVIADGTGTIAFTKGGAGTSPLTLTGANTYSGATTVSTYSLTVSGNGTLGNTVGGTSVTSGATLRLGVTSCAEAITISGVGFQAGEGALEGYDTTLTGLLALGASATVASFAPAGATFAITNPGTILGAGRTLTLSGFAGSAGSIASIIGTTTGGVTVTDGAIWTLTGANTFSGIVTVDSNGTLIIPTINNAGVAGPLGSSSATTAVSLTTGTLEYTGGTASSTKPFALSTSGAFQIDSAATELTLSGAISGVGDALVKTGPGTLTLSNASNSYSGGTTISAGTLKLSGSGRLGATTGALVLQSGKLDLGGTDQTVGSLLGYGTIVNNGGGSSVLTVNTSATNNVLNNFVFDNDNGTAGTVGLTKLGTGTLTLALGGTSNYSGAVQVTNGILVAGSPDALGSAATGTTVSSGAALRIQSANIAAEPIEISGAGETGTEGALEGSAATYGGLLKLNAASTIASILALSDFSFDLTNPGTITGATFTLTLAGAGTGSIASIIGTTSGGLIKTDTGTWTLTGANTYSGTTTISAGILNIQDATATGTTAGGISITSGATLQIEGDIAVGAEALTIRGIGDAAGGATGALENVSGTNTFGGLLTLGANSTISSDAGTLNLTNTGVINDLFDLTLAGAGDGSIASVIATGANTVTKSGTGKWTLSGVNTFTGALTVQSGTLSIPTFNNASAAGPLGNSATAVTLGAAAQTGTIEYTGASVSSTKPFALATGGVGAFQIDLAGTELTLTGQVSGAGTLQKTGPGTLTLASGKSFTGSTLVSEGTLKLTVASAIGSSSGIVVESGGVLLLAGAAGLNRIADTIPLTLSGGTFSTEGLSNATETLGTFNLTVADSAIDFGSGSGDSLFFTGVGAHTAGLKLAVLNWSGTPNQLGGASNDRLIFSGANPSAFTTTYNFADVSFDGVSGYLALQADASHYEIVAIPEPSAGALLGGAALLGAVGFSGRRYERRK